MYSKSFLLNNGVCKTSCALCLVIHDAIPKAQPATVLLHLSYRKWSFRSNYLWALLKEIKDSEVHDSGIQWCLNCSSFKWKLRISDFYQVQYLERVRSEFQQKLCTSCLGFLFFSFFKLLVNTLSYPAVLTTQKAAMNMMHLEIQLTTCLYKSNHKRQSLGFSVSIKLKAVSSSSDNLYILMCNLLITTQRNYIHRAVSFCWQCLPTCGQSNAQFRHPAGFYL